MANPRTFPSCPHKHNCDCAGGVHSYAPAYQTVLNLLKPRLVVEWGPGKNTQMALAAGSSVVSIEQDPKWLPRLTADNHVIIHLRQTSQAYTGKTTRFFGYLDADLFFVDSRRRAECLQAVHQLCRQTSVVCLHDAQRQRYHQALALFDFVIFPVTGFAVATKDESVYNKLRERLV